MSTYTHRSRVAPRRIPPQLGGVRRLFGRLVLAGFMLAGAACESGVFLAGQLTTIGGGIGGSGTGPEFAEFSIGPITATTVSGDIVVNGTTFDTQFADITIDDRIASVGELREGMVAAVAGNGLLTTTITVSAAVAGPVQRLSPDRLSLVVLGQLVLIDETAIIDISVPGESVGDLNIGDLVRVYGLVKDNGVLAATRIEYATALREFQVKGFIDNFPPGPAPSPDFHEEFAPPEGSDPLEAFGSPEEPGLFVVGELTVDYSAADLSGFTAILNPGQLVMVTGQNVLTARGKLLATKVEHGGIKALFENGGIEGFVTYDEGEDGEFGLTDVIIVPKRTTLFAGGTGDEIVRGTRLEVETSFGEIHKIIFRDNIKLESNVAAVGRNTLALAGLPEIVVTVNSLTSITGARLSDLSAGDHVCIRGRAAARNVIASRVDKCNSDTDVVLQATVDLAADPIVTLMGARVDTNSFEDDDFADLDNTGIGRDTFFGSAAPGTLVKANGSLVGSNVVWHRAELEQ